MFFRNNSSMSKGKSLRKRYFRKSGFTLVEVLLASMLGAFVAMVAVGALKAVTTSAEAVDDSVNISAEARYASKIIRRDLLNLYRDKDVKNMRLVGAVENSDDGTFSHLILCAVGRTKARIGQPEGDVYEVEYFLQKKDDKSVLFRRLWPNPDREAEAGGVLTAVAENIDVFEVRFYDGEQWYIEWPEESDDIAKLVEVTIVARQPEEQNYVMDSFVVNFARAGWGQSEQGGSQETSEKEEKQEE